MDFRVKKTQLDHVEKSRMLVFISRLDSEGPHAVVQIKVILNRL